MVTKREQTHALNSDPSTDAAERQYTPRLERHQPPTQNILIVTSLIQG